MSQQCEYSSAPRSGSAPTGPSPILLRSGRLTVVVADAGRLNWLAELGTSGGPAPTGRRLVPDRDPRTAPVRDTAPLVPRNLAARLDAEAFLLVLADGRPAGSCWLGWQGDGPWGFLPARSGYVTELVVRPGPLVGTAVNLLLRTAATHAADQGRPLLRMACAAANRPLRDCLDTADFRQIGVQTPPGGRPPQALYEHGRCTV